MEVSGQLHVPTALHRGKEPQGGSQSRSEICGMEKNLLPMLGIEPRLSNLWPVAIPTELPRPPLNIELDTVIGIPHDMWQVFGQ
jgi:hypothetical protein